MAIKRLQVGPRMSQAVIHGDTVYTAGQVAIDAPGASVTKQTQDVLNRIDKLLAEAGRHGQNEAAVRHHLALGHGHLQRDERGLGYLGGSGQHTVPGLRERPTGSATV